MSTCRARLRNTSNAITFRMSGEQIRSQVPPKMFGVNSWIAQIQYTTHTGVKLKQDAQLSQRDRAAGCISFGQKWKNGTGRQYFTDII